MGVKGFSAFAKKHQLYSETVNLQEFKEMFKGYKVYVDLYGSFFDLIRYYALDERYRAFAKCSNEIFDGMDVIFVLDGARSAEKHEAHLARETQRDLRMQSFSHNLNSVDPQSRVSTSVWKRLDKLRASCFRLMKYHTNCISEAFEKENLSFVQAPYEADVAIARLLSPSNSDKMSNTIIISNDSDLLFYGHPIVGKSFFKNKLDCLSLHFTLFREQIALKKIGISRECWRALAVVTGNDYVSNLRGFGIARCLKEFQKINENGACTAEEMVETFEQSHDKKGHFQIASAVFLNYQETSCAVCVESLQEQMFKDCCSQLQLLKENYGAARAANRQTTQGRSLQELKHLKVPSQNNRYSPMVHIHFGRYKVKSVGLNKLRNLSITPAATLNSSVSIKPRPYNKSKKRKGKKKNKRARYLKSAMFTRSVPSENPHGAHKLSQATLDIKMLKQKYQMKTWELGTLKSQVKKSSLDATIQNTILKRLQNVVKLVNKASQAAIIIADLFFQNVQNNLIVENELLFGVGGGCKVWYNLISFLLSPEKRGRKGRKLFQKMKKFVEDNELGLNLTEEELEYVSFCSGYTLQAQSKLMDSIVARHFVGSARLLAQSVMKNSPFQTDQVEVLLNALMSAVEQKGTLPGSLESLKSMKDHGVNLDLIENINNTEMMTSHCSTSKMKLRPRKRKLEESADETKPEPTIPQFDPTRLETYSVVRWFFLLNDMLPVSQRYRSFPNYQPSFFPLSLTEDCLLGIIGTKDSRLWFADFLDPLKAGPLMKRDKTGELLQLSFGLKSAKYRKYRLIGQKDLGERFVLNTSFETDGFSLSIHVIDTKYRKLKKNPPPPVVSRDRAYIKGKDIIMGLDMGQAYTVGAVSWLPDGSKKNLAVKKKAQGEPYYLHRNWLNKTKMKDENKPVRDAENCGLSRNSDETITIYFNRMMERYSVWANFYNSHAIRKRTFEYHCAKQREMDRVFNALISMVGLKPHQKVKKKQRIYVGIGTGDFDATGSLHTSFLEYFVRKARPLGITILGVDEYFTSQKCVRCHEFTESLSMRAKKCSKCNVVFHRDILAADNMCAALSAILQNGERPEYLCKPPDDKSDDDNDEQDDGLNKKDRNGRNPKEKKKKKPKDKESGQSTSSEYALENAAKKKSASYVLGSARVIVQ